MVFSTGVSTSINPLPSKKLRTWRIKRLRISNVRRTSGFTIRSRYDGNGFPGPSSRGTFQEGQGFCQKGDAATVDAYLLRVRNTNLRHNIADVHFLNRKKPPHKLVYRHRAGCGPCPEYRQSFAHVSLDIIVRPQNIGVSIASKFSLISAVCGSANFVISKDHDPR